MDVTKLSRLSRKALPLKYCGAVIVAAGNASRMKGVDKILAELGGKPVIRRTAESFQACDAVSEIVIVTRPDLIPQIGALTRDLDKVTAVVAGGADRAESVRLGLNALSDKVKLAAIHDGARPFASWQMIDRVIRAGNSYGAAAPAIPVKDTIKIAKGGVVESTPERKNLYAVQTPQVFDFDLLRGALKKAWEEKLPITDDCSAVEAMGMAVKLVEGEETNIKITTPLDLKLGEAILEEMT